ncbi:MAG: hypothetical protein R6V25_03490 [Desulfatiglandales bacterium]
MVLDLDKKSSFLNWKFASAQKAFLDGHPLIFQERSAEAHLKPNSGQGKFSR